MRIAALFSDYDGTLAAADVARELSAIPSAPARDLAQIARRVPLAIITSKDFRFIYPRTRFASAWACMGGLELMLADGTGHLSASRLDVGYAVDLSRTLLGASVLVEEKRDSSGRLQGFSIDWTNSREPRLLRKAMDQLRSEGFYVGYDRIYPYFDVFAGPPDKGRALQELRSALKVDGAIMFMGDSQIDNPAFLAAECRVGVSHGQPTRGLLCDFTVDYPSLHQFLSSILKAGMQFSEQLPGVRRMEGE